MQKSTFASKACCCPRTGIRSEARRAVDSDIAVGLNSRRDLKSKALQARKFFFFGGSVDSEVEIIKNWGHQQWRLERNPETLTQMVSVEEHFLSIFAIKSTNAFAAGEGFLRR